MYYNCPNCSNEIIKSYPNGKHKLRTNIVIWENGKAFCKCQQCHSDVEVPVSLDLPSSKKIKYYVLDEEVKSARTVKSEKSKS